MNRMLLEYAMNAAWQLPLLVAGGFVLLRALRARPEVQHGVWLGVLGLAVAMPGVRRTQPMHLAVLPEVRVSERERVAAASAVSMAHGGVGSAGATGGSDSRPWGEVRLSERATHWAARLYVGAMLLAGARLLRGWAAAQALVRSAELVAGAAQQAALLTQLAQASAEMGVRQPELWLSDALQTPAVSGVVKPLLLLPRSFGGCTEGEARAMLAHELTHVRRRDTLVQLASEVVAIPLAWHPAMWAIRQRLRQTREMACDAAAARAMHSATGYARCLLAMAGRAGGAEWSAAYGPAMPLFGASALEERILQLVTLHQPGSRWATAARVAGGVVVAAAAVLAAGTLHVQPTLAQESLRPQAAETRRGSMPRRAAAAPQAAEVQFHKETAAAAMQSVAEAPLVRQRAVPRTVQPLRRPGASEPQRLVMVKSHIFPSLLFQRESPRLEIASALGFKLAWLGQAAAAPAPAAPAAVLGTSSSLAAAPPKRLTAPVPPTAPDSLTPPASPTAPDSPIAPDSPAAPVQDQGRSLLEQQARRAEAMVNSPEFRKRIADAERQAQKAQAMVNSREFRKRMEEAAAAMKRDSESMQRDLRQMEERRETEVK